jgi:class 3 adenylate cyclase
VDWRRIERTTILAAGTAAALPFLFWIFAWDLPANPRPGPNPGGLWSFLFDFSGRPNTLVERISDAEVRNFLGLLLDGTAAIGLLTFALAAVLAWRGYGNAGARLLCIALTMSEISISYDSFVRELTPLRSAPAVVVGATDLAIFILDAVTYVLWYRILRRFPAEVRIEELEQGRRRAGLTRVNATIIRRLDNPRFLYPFMALVCLVDIGAWLYGHAAGMPRPIASLMPVIGTIIVLEGLNVMIFNGRRVVAADRRFEWIYLGLWYGLFAVCAAVLSGGLVGRVLHLPVVSMLEWIARVAFVGQFMFLGLLALALFYQGALDARLVIRRTAVIAFLGMVTGIVFIAAERIVALLVVRSLALPQEWAWVLAGVVAAMAVVPVRRFSDRAFAALADRLSTPADLADGEKTHAVIVFSDLSGFTALSARDERSAIIAASLLHKTARDTARAYGGRLVKTIGDAVVMEFAQPAAAVAATMEVHSKYGQGSAALDLPPLEVHSGIHSGEIVKARDGDIYGSTVNLTARLQDAAKAGEIVVSEAVSASARGDTFSWQAMGERLFKNVPNPVACSLLVHA